MSSAASEASGRTCAFPGLRAESAVPGSSHRGRGAPVAPGKHQHSTTALTYLASSSKSGTIAPSRHQRDRSAEPVGLARQATAPTSVPASQAPHCREGLRCCASRRAPPAMSERQSDGGNRDGPGWFSIQCRRRSFRGCYSTLAFRLQRSTLQRRVLFVQLTRVTGSGYVRSFADHAFARSLAVRGARRVDCREARSRTQSLRCFRRSGSTLRPSNSDRR